MTCNCKACNDLRDECGEHFLIYSKKLLIRGWAGVMSPVERAYMRAHRSEAQQLQAQALSVRAKSMGAARFSRATDAGAAPGRVSTPGDGCRRDLEAKP